MSEVVIRAENLGKRYTLGQTRERYTTLRDVIVKQASSLKRSLMGDRRVAPPQNEEFWALRDVSFEVRHGDVVGIIGRNGAGKSTLLKILSRITEPTTGRVMIQGRVASLLEVGTGFHPELTGRENIFLNGAILGMSKAEIRRKFDEIVAFAEVERFLDTPVKRFSSGMYVRLAFAVAAHLEPEILVVDEVLAVGDASFQKKCLGKMQDVAQREGRTVLFVSHNMAAVQTLCNSGLLLESGNLLVHQGIKETIDRYSKLNSEVKFFSPKNVGNRFLEINIQDEYGTNLSVVGVNRKAYLNFKLWIENNRDINVGFTLYNQTDIPLLSSCVSDTLEEIPMGLSELRLELPVDLLTTGEYRVEGAIWDHFKVYDQNDYLATFRMERNSLIEARGISYRGILAFSGKWEFRKPC